MTRMKQAMITGCDYGLGAELAREGLARGFRVFAGCLNPAKAAAMKMLAREHGRRLAVLRMDMGSERSVDRACAVIRKKTEKLHLLVSNAGVYWTDGLDRLSFKGLRRMFDVNAFGPARLARNLRGLLRASGEGRIVNISSESGSLALGKRPPADPGLRGEQGRPQHAGAPHVVRAREGRDPGRVRPPRLDADAHGPAER